MDFLRIYISINLKCKVTGLIERKCKNNTIRVWAYAISNIKYYNFVLKFTISIVLVLLFNIFILYKINIKIWVNHLKRAIYALHLI